MSDEKTEQDKRARCYRPLPTTVLLCVHVALCALDALVFFTGADVRGINGPMLHQFIDDTLAQTVEGLDRYPLLLFLDRAPIHLNTDSLLQTFRDRSSESIKEIQLLPPNAAKRVSPLDNALFHDWKQECRKHSPLTADNIQQVMNDAWEKMQPKQHYKHCGLTRTKDLYFDCPAPALHQHGN